MFQKYTTTSVKRVWTTSKCCIIGPSRGVTQFGCIGMTVGLRRGAVPLSSMASYYGTATGLPPPIIDFGGRPRLGRVATVISVPWFKRAGFNRSMDTVLPASDVEEKVLGMPRNHRKRAVIRWLQWRLVCVTTNKNKTELAQETGVWWIR